MQGIRKRLCGPIMEVELLLLRLTLDYKMSKLQETQTQAVVRNCCCCYYETSRGSAGWGDGVIVLESMRICRPHKKFSTLRPLIKKVRFKSLHFLRVRVDGRPKRRNICAFSHKNTKERFRVDDVFIMQDSCLLLKDHSFTAKTLRANYCWNLTVTSHTHTHTHRLWTQRPLYAQAALFVFLYIISACWAYCAVSQVFTISCGWICLNSCFLLYYL